MRAIFGIISLLLVLVIVGSLVKKQLSVQTTPLQNLPSASPAPVDAAASPHATVREQSQQIQQQVKQAVEAQIQARPMPDDSK